MLGNLVSIFSWAGLLGRYLDKVIRYVGPLEMQKRYAMCAVNYIGPGSESDRSRILASVRCVLYESDKTMFFFVATTISLWITCFLYWSQNYGLVDLPIK